MQKTIYCVIGFLCGLMVRDSYAAYAAREGWNLGGEILVGVGILGLAVVLGAWSVMDLWRLARGG